MTDEDFIEAHNEACDDMWGVVRIFALILTPAVVGFVLLVGTILWR